MVVVKVLKFYNFYFMFKFFLSLFVINFLIFFWCIMCGIICINVLDFCVYFDLLDVSKYDKGIWDIGFLSFYILFNEVNIGILYNVKFFICLLEYRSLFYFL